MRITRTALIAWGLMLGAASTAAAADLAGSPASMARQHDAAVEEHYSFLRTAEQVREFAEKGRLLEVEESADVALADVSYPYAREEVLLFVERLGAEYHLATGKRLVITSLTRPTATQPANAHQLSVHPAGMAVDLRVPATADDRAWLERTLLALEGEGVLDVTREKHPPHYHVAVYPEQYRAYAATLPPVPPRPARAAAAPAPAASPAPATAIGAEPPATRAGEVRDALLVAAAVPMLVLLGLAGHRLRLRLTTLG